MANGRLWTPNRTRSITSLEIELRHLVQQTPTISDFKMGHEVYEGQRIYGVSFKHGGKRWELSVGTNNPNRKLVDEGIVHLLSTCIADIRERFS